MKKSIISILAVLALTASIVYAQHHNAAPDQATHIQRHVEHMAKMLGLTEAQQQQAIAMLTSAAETEKNFHEQLRAAHKGLEVAVQKNDTAGIDQAANTIGNLTGQMTAAQAKSHAAMLQSLTPEQQAKMKEMMESHGHEFGPGMHGHMEHGEAMHHDEMKHEK
ncbi:MAG TPA: Spy/CpxP family protein refolding chaperone [Candidatus Saccharimonadales bacterium]|jgi:Spy/CpxP family protein refolding chaperone|nr:Spy/CpxP family protein refolding chaperone [Candidatus Saccharimonadales bacterium]